MLKNYNVEKIVTLDYSDNAEKNTAKNFLKLKGPESFFKRVDGGATLYVSWQRVSRRSPYDRSVSGIIKFSTVISLVFIGLN